MEISYPQPWILQPVMRKHFVQLTSVLRFEDRKYYYVLYELKVLLYTIGYVNIIYLILNVLICSLLV